VNLRLDTNWSRLVQPTAPVPAIYPNLRVHQTEALIAIVAGALLPRYIERGPSLTFHYEEDGEVKEADLHLKSLWPSPLTDSVADACRYLPFDPKGVGYRPIGA
jgi:hypothetical protein